MKRLAIIDHAGHQLLIEDVSEESLEKYNGSAEKYIKDNYTFDGNFSWDYITDTEYFPEGESDPYDVEFSDII